MPLSDVRSRHEMVRYLDGYSVDRMEEVETRRLRKPLVKTHLIELVGCDSKPDFQSLERVFQRLGVKLAQIEEQLFLVRGSDGREMGILEQLGSRILALYSIEEASAIAKWVHKLVQEASELDHVWLSGLTFSVLWKYVAKLSKANRYTRLVFRHESIFDVDSRAEVEPDDEGDFDLDEQTDDLPEIVERRVTSFRLTDRLGVIQEKLDKLQQLYSPLYAISQLRFPSPVGPGGHDFYDDGRVTNRSPSFRDHRSHVLFVVRIYEQLLKVTEQSAWYSIGESVSTPGHFKRIVGSPVVIQFQGPGLTKEVFAHWISATFRPQGNRFRLWGHPIRLGPGKVHIYGVDRHLWHPLFMELTTAGCIAIIPNGTCGNTIHRLVTNIQRYLDPGAQASIGNVRYETLVEDSAKQVSYDRARE